MMQRQDGFASYEAVKKLGRGAFGTAILLRGRSGDLVVAKEISMTGMSAAEIAKVEQEVALPVCC